MWTIYKDKMWTICSDKMWTICKDKILYIQRWDSEQESWQTANDMPEVKTDKKSPRA